MKNSQLLKFVCDHLKTKNFEKFPFVIRYVLDQYKTVIKLF